MRTAKDDKKTPQDSWKSKGTPLTREELDEVSTGAWYGRGGSLGGFTLAAGCSKETCKSTSDTGYGCGGCG